MRQHNPGTAARLALALITCLLTPLPLLAQPGVRTSNEGVVAGSYGYSETATDMTVKVLGGKVRVRREWSDGDWTFFPSWQALEPRIGDRPVAGGFDGLASGERADTIVRGRYDYERVAGSSPARWRFDETRWIVATGSGYEWRNRAGEWIAYDAQGRMTAYGGRNDVRVSVERDTEGRIHRVLDHHGEMAVAFDYDGQGRLVRARDRSGREVEYHWDGAKLTAVTDVRGERWQYGYTNLVDQRRLKRRTDPDGRTTELVYATIGGTTACVPTGDGHWQQDNSGQLTWSGRCTQKSVPPRAYLKAKKDARGVIERYRYAWDGDGKRFVRVTEKGGVLTERILDDEGRIKERRIDGETVVEYRYGDSYRIRIDSRGHETRTDLNAHDEPVRRTYPDGATEKWRYNRFGRVTRHVNEVGTVTKHTYDDNGNRTQTIEARGAPAERVIEYAYDEHGQRISRKLLGDARTKAGERTWTYDRHGNVATMTDAAGHTRTFTEYNARGDAEAWTDRAGHDWSQTFDAAGNRVSRTDPLGHKKEWAYDGAGNRIAAIDALGNRTEYTFDDAGLLISVTDALGATTTLGYDARRRVTEVTDADGVTRRLVYNDAGRLAKSVDPAGIAREMVYGDPDTNAEHDQLARIEGPRRTTEYRYDKRGRRTAVIVTGANETVQTTRYAYDAAGRLTKTVEPGGRETLFEHDALGRRTAITDPAGHITRLEYNDHGMVTTFTNRRDVVFRRFEYNERGLRTRVTRPGGASVTYEYDALERLVKRTDAKGQVRRSRFDAAGRRIASDYFADAEALTQNAPARSTTYTFDAAGRLTGYDDGNTSATYTLDALGRLTEARIDYGSFSAGYNQSYTSAGRLASLTYPNGKTVEYAFDDGGRLSRITRANGAAVGFDYQNATGRLGRIRLPGGSERTWSYDGLGRIERMRAKDPAGNSLMERRYAYTDAGHIDHIDTREGRREYSYDQLGRLTRAAKPDGEANTFAYDRAGNRIASGATNGDWQYGDDNRLVAQGESTYDYDENGARTAQTTSDGTTVFEQNIRRRVERIDLPDGTTLTQTYDPMGRRVSKTVDGTTTYFLYSKQGMIAEFGENGITKRSYGWMPNRDWSTSPIWMSVDDKNYYYVNDHLGTPQHLVDRSGSIKWSADYGAFGETAAKTNQVNQPWRFPGQYSDKQIGLNYNWHRFYDPESGTYSRRDPLGLVGGLNGYTYAYSDPIKNYDSSGRIGAVVPVIIRVVARVVARGSRAVARGPKRRPVPGRPVGPGVGPAGPKPVGGPVMRVPMPRGWPLIPGFGLVKIIIDGDFDPSDLPGQIDPSDTRETVEEKPWCSPSWGPPPDPDERCIMQAELKFGWCLQNPRNNPVRCHLRRIRDLGMCAVAALGRDPSDKH